MGSATGATVVYSTDGNTWFGKDMNRPGTNRNNDRWHANLGKFPAGTVIQYAMVTTDATGSSIWASNGGKNYRAVVNP